MAVTLPIFNFWFELTLLSILACLLIYGIFDTRFQVARAKGAAAVEVLRRNSRRLWILIAGTTVIIVGIVISPLPGPGFSVLGPIGLAILASEFVWAQKLTNQIKERSGPRRDATQQLALKTPKWVPIPVSLAYWSVPVLLAIFSPVPQFVIWPAASILFAPVFLWCVLVSRASKVAAPAAAATATPRDQAEAA
ncbi:MAG: PGPGW domain-containing protein [Phycisphaerae bacterium]